jgi:hypothetical protein
LLGDVPLGITKNEHDALITTWLANASYVKPAGSPVTVFDRGDVWVRNTYTVAAYGYKVYANLASGAITTAVTGQTLTDPLGTATIVTASSATTVLTVTATNGVIAHGMRVTGTFANGLVVPPGVYIVSQATGTRGSTGTYNLSVSIGTGTSIATIALVKEDGYGGWTGTATFATNVMTVVSTTTGLGAIAVGQIITSAGVTAGTYITADLGGGTYSLSTTPGTITPAQAATATDWIETPWVVKSQSQATDGLGIGELIKIGIKN